MNERIKELAIKAGFDLDVHDSGDGNFYGWEGRWINREITEFAELIKQAIYDKVKEELIPDDVIAEEKLEHQEYLKGCNGGTVDALCHIKQFGVNIDE
jgi:hypothetical protein